MPDYGLDPYTRATVVDARAGIVQYTPRRTKVAIIGTGPSRQSAPWDDPTWVCWGLNEFSQKRASVYFEMHPKSVQNARELAWLSQCPTPCYVLDLAEWDGLIPHPVQYPLDRLRAAGFRPYATSTFAYQVMLALLDGFTEIGLWGCELYLGTARERTVERACLEYWLGVAEGHGVTVVADSGLARERYLYGYDYHAESEDIARQMRELGEVIEYERKVRQ